MQPTVQLLDDEGQCDLLTLADIDPILAATFESMIQEAFAEGKHFFVARIRSRQDQSTESEVSSKTHSHYFNAMGILKIIFQKKGADQFVGRFHDRFPISARNPVTNQRIIDEVVFYIIENQHLKNAELAALRAQAALNNEQAEVTAKTEATPLVGVFFGTDFNFLHSQEMQEALFTNCPSNSVPHLLSFVECACRPDDFHLPEQVLSGQTNEYIQKTFNSQRLFIQTGWLNLLCYFFALYAFWQGLIPLVQGKLNFETELSDEKLSFHIFYYSSRWLPQSTTANLR
jgi:hypothetical protein